MLDKIDKLKSMIDEDLTRLKSIQTSLKKIQSLIKKNDYISSQKISKGKLRSVLAENYPNSTGLLDEIDHETTRQIRKFKINFDQELISSCEESGMTPISGDSRKGFKIRGIIKVAIDFEKGKSTVKTLSKKNKVNSIKIQEIIKEITKVNKRLFERKWVAGDFLKELYEAYTAVSKGNFDKEVPLKDVQTRLWLKSQNESFWKSFDKDRLNNYPTDEFSVDLSKLLSSKPQISNDIEYLISEGADGITVHDNSGNFRSFKFIKFTKGGNQ